LHEELKSGSLALQIFLIFRGSFMKFIFALLFVSATSLAQITMTQGLLVMANKVKNQKQYCDLTHLEVSALSYSFSSYGSTGKLLCKCTVRGDVQEAQSIAIMYSANVGKKNMTVLCNSEFLFKGGDGAWYINGIDGQASGWFRFLVGPVIDPAW
jgi:hypothetical protein